MSDETVAHTVRYVTVWGLGPDCWSWALAADCPPPPSFANRLVIVLGLEYPGDPLPRGDPARTGIIGPHTRMAPARSADLSAPLQREALEHTR